MFPVSFSIFIFSKYLSQLSSEALFNLTLTCPVI